MMKRKIGLILGLLCGLIVPLATHAEIQDGIYEVLGGEAKTVKFDNVALTVATESLSGTYHWGFNENSDNSVWTNEEGTGTYYSGGVMYGNTNHLDSWGGSGDMLLELLDNGNDRSLRKGPCMTGWHVPSIGERERLFVARCKIDKSLGGECDPDTMITYSDYWWQPTLSISNNSKISGFSKIFNLNSNFSRMFWSSSFGGEANDDPFYVGFYESHIYVDDQQPKHNKVPVICFKDEPITKSSISYDIDEDVTTGSIDLGNKLTKPADPELTGHTFKYWHLTGTDTEFDFTTPITGDTTLYAKFEINQYTITFDTAGGNNIAPITGDYGTGITAPANPTKNGYTFDGREPAIPYTMPAENLTVKAKRTKKSSGGSSGGGGGMKKDNCPNGDLSPSYYDGACEGDNTQDSSDKSSEGQTGSQEILSPADDSFTKEQKDAYTFAFKNGITTMNTIHKANMDGYIKRGHLAKMVVNYVTNVLGREIPSDIPASCLSFSDETTARESEEIKDYATKSCALGLMGIRMKNNEFLPNDYVTRAEFGTVLSRILRGDKYNKTHTQDSPWYSAHLNALKEEGIMTKIDNPQMQEKRGYVMIMLMRSVK